MRIQRVIFFCLLGNIELYILSSTLMSDIFFEVQSKLINHAIFQSTQVQST